MGHPARELLDPAKSAHVSARVPCDGHTAREDEVGVHSSFSQGGALREFTVNRFHQEACAVDIKGKCMHKEKAEWRAVWSATSDQSSSSETVSIGACYAWGSSEPAQYVVSGWYQDTENAKKPIWKQLTVKQASQDPEVFEFTDPSGGTGRLELRRW